MAREYYNLVGILRDLEHAIEAGGVREWDLLSRLDNCLFAIEEAADEVEDLAVEQLAADDDDRGPDEGSVPLVVDRRDREDEHQQRLGTEVPARAGDAERRQLELARVTAPLGGAGVARVSAPTVTVAQFAPVEVRSVPRGTQQPSTPKRGKPRMPAKGRRKGVKRGKK